MSSSFVEHLIAVINTTDSGVKPRSKVEVLKGFSPFITSIEIGGDMQIDDIQKIKKKTTTYDWQMLFDLYDVPLNASLDDWVAKYKSHADKTLLDRMLPHIEKREFNPSCDVVIHASGTSIKKLKLGFRVLRLKTEQATKDAVLLNAANIAAYDDSGHEYSKITPSCH